VPSTKHSIKGWIYIRCVLHFINYEYPFCNLFSLGIVFPIEGGRTLRQSAAIAITRPGEGVVGAERAQGDAISTQLRCVQLWCWRGPYGGFNSMLHWTVYKKNI